jgi:4-hydroxybutyrate dehydrogenase
MSVAVSSFSFPTATVFGPGSMSELPLRVKQIGSRRPLVVTDAGLIKTRAFDILTHTLDTKQLGQSWELFHGVHSNPLEQDVVEAAKVFRATGCDAVIAFGGGSAMDVGKACRLLVKRPDLKLDKFNLQDDWSGIPRCICIPTTAGTGSEVGRSVVITLAGTQRRATISLPRLLAKLVILDPELTVSLPGELTAATGMDALTHCIEAFTSPSFQPFCDGIALEGIHLIIEALPRVIKDGKDLNARGRMLVAASMGGVAMQKELGATHSLANPLSATCSMHHGTANAICLPHVMEFNARRKPGLYRRVGAACGLDVMRGAPEDADRKTIDFVRNLIRGLGITQGLRAFGVKEAMLETLATQAFADPNQTTNPVPINRDELKAIYKAAM